MAADDEKFDPVELRLAERARYLTVDMMRKARDLTYGVKQEKDSRCGYN